MYEENLSSDSLEYQNPEMILMCQETPAEDYDDDTTQEDINMTTKSTSTTVQETTTLLDGMKTSLSGISQFPLGNIIQGMAQALVREIGRAQAFQDRVELGDDAVFDANGARPAPDAVDGDRTISERQMELLVQTADDEAAMVAALVEVKAFYTFMFSDNKLVYTIVDDGRGGWKQVTDYAEAINVEYRKAQQAYFKRQQQATRQGFTPEGAQAARDAAKAQRDKMASQL